MSVKIICPECSARLVLKHDELPERVRCPKCQQRFRPELISARAEKATSADDSGSSGSGYDLAPGDAEAGGRSETRAAGPRTARPTLRSATGSGETDAEGNLAAPLTPGPSPGGRRESGVFEAGGTGSLDGKWRPGGNANDLIRAVVQAFRGQVVHRRPTWGYRIALLFTAFGLWLLIVAYAACLVGIAWGLYLYAVHVVPPTLHLRAWRAMVVVFAMHAAVLLPGAAILYSLIAPLFSWNRGQPDGRLLAAGAHPVLHSFVRALCTLIEAPQPDEIRTEIAPNASAGRYGGLFGIVGGRLVLTIGEPLFYALDLRSLAGVIAHELGHFSQATSRLLYRYIVNVTIWFQEATVRTSGVQDAIVEHGDDAEGSARLFVWIAYLLTGLGRLLLLGFALLSRMMTFHLSRQMEFDADRYAAEVAGSGQFARMSERVIELHVAFENVCVSLLSGQLAVGPGPALAAHVAAQADEFSDRDRRKVSRMMKPQKAKWFDSHPSPTERIAAVAREPKPGIFQLEGPALCLLNTKVVS